LPDKPSSQTGKVPAEALWFQAINEIGIINQLTTAEFTKVMPHGLTLAQFTVLNHCVRMGDNRTPADLAAAFQVTRGTLTSTLKRLETKDFITLAPDPEDGRSKRVLLTAKGRKARENAIAATEPLLLVMVEALPSSLLNELMPRLQELRKYLDENRSA